jgi:hypothetical protein
MRNLMNRFVLFVFAAVMFFAGRVDAGKPAPPPPPAEVGTVFFQLGTAGSVYGMKADGTNLAKVVDANDIAAAVWDYSNDYSLSPSSKKYNGQHWWLWRGAREDGAMMPAPWNGSPIREVFVGIPGILEIRVTNLWDDYRLSLYGTTQIAWSNDNGDTFFSTVAREFVQDPATGAWSFGPPQLYKIPFQVTADANGDPVPSAAEPVLDGAGNPLLDEDGNPILHTAIAAVVPLPEVPTPSEFSWSPDGTTVLYRDVEQSKNPDTNNDRYRVQLYRHSIGDVAPVLVWEDDGYSGFLGPQTLLASWSPDATRIAFGLLNRTSSIGRDIVTIPGNAEGLVGRLGMTTVLSGGTKRAYSVPCWSPANGSQIVAQEIDASKGIDTSKWPRNIVRLQSSGNSPVKLTGALDPLADKYLLGWRLGLPWAPAE